MLTTMGHVALLATLVLGGRAATGWSAYHKAQISRATLLNRAMVAIGGAGATGACYLAAKLTGF